VAPTTLASRVRPEHLRILADTARRLKLHLHSHFAETDDDEDWCREHYGCSLIDLCDDNGWLGPDAWFAHMVRLRPEDVRRLGAAGVGMAHCPASNARLGSGIAPVMELEASGVRIGMGVDGAGSNESAEMLSELHFAWLVHRTRAETTDDGSLRSPSSADLMRWATSGGADILGLETGRIAAGWPADLAVYRPTEAGHLGLHDPSSCLVVTAARPGVELVLCDGRALVKQGTLVATDFAELRARAMRAMAQLRQTQ
jgi:cytosine/adenosine deaminase-related metal-dependent hydrolase